MRPDDVTQEAWDSAQRWMEEGFFYNPSYPEDEMTGLRRTIASAIMAAKAEEREACIAAANDERVLPFYVNPAEATEPDKAYDQAIDHVVDAIRNRK